MTTDPLSDASFRERIARLRAELDVSPEPGDPLDRDPVESHGPGDEGAGAGDVREAGVTGRQMSPDEGPPEPRR
jgi:hypothetical protein